MTSPAPLAQTPALTRTAAGGVEAKAVLLGDRIDVRGYGPSAIVSQVPLAFLAPGGGLVTIYRFGAVVFAGAPEAEQTRILADLAARVIDPALPLETESVMLFAEGRGEDAIAGDGRLSLVDLSTDRLLIVADALAKSVALADDERYVGKVFEQIEPFAQNLAATGMTALTSKALLKLLGEALVAQARMVGRVAVQEKPDLLWDRPDLQRLFARLEDEYELSERESALSRKLKVIEESASTLADVTDARHSLRLEVAIVALIAVEIVLSLIEMWRSVHH